MIPAKEFEGELWIKASDHHQAIKAALAQPAQEPVATIDSLEQEIYENTREFVSLNVMEWLLNRLSTTPLKREWVGLTDEEIDKIRNTPMSVEGGVGFSIYSYARAIEQTLKGKNT